LKRGGFQLAAIHGIPVVPVALEYGSAKDYWIGNDTFLPHFIQRFGEKNMCVSVRYGPPLRSDDADFLMTQTRQWIDEQIPEMRREFF
jgi:1-acyl-sn-glycerol-3-phosphate acyltransferase